MNATTIAVDLAKSVFQVSIANSTNRIVDRKRLTRSQFERFLAEQPSARVVMEACATANYWSQYAQAHGHDTAQLHTRYVRPYVRRNKTDAADADALIRASKDPQLLPVPTKQPDQQALQALHRCRQQLIDTRKRRIVMARAILAEFGISLARGANTIETRLSQHVDEVPSVLATTLRDIIVEIDDLKQRTAALDQQLASVAAQHPIATLLMTIPGIGVISATAMIASVPDIHVFKRARQFSAWLGITPREYSSGSKRRLGAISRQGDRYLRTLLIHGARSALLQAHRRAATDKALSELQRWAIELESRRPRNVATVALANKMARIIWSTWTQERSFQPLP